VRDAALVVEGEPRRWVGPGDAPLPMSASTSAARVVPGFVDSHTHLVFAGERSAEFAARMAGEPYTGGGIMTTVAATRAASTSAPREHPALAAEMLSLGTTTVEIKSGYGLTVADRGEDAAIAREFTAETTFLGAHVVPAEYAHDRDGYVALVCGEMLEACAPLARWIDVFCDTGAFDADETRRCSPPGVSAGLLPRLHGNQLEHGAGRADRGRVRRGERRSLHAPQRRRRRRAAPIPESSPRCFPAPTSPPVRRTRTPARLLDAGVTVALATDCNPGSLLHHLDAALHRAGGPRDAHDARRGAVRRHRGRRCRSSPPRRHRVGAPSARRGSSSRSYSSCSPVLSASSSGR
jgi:imidazolonepropionase